jgi:hypothetical protein
VCRLDHGRARISPAIGKFDGANETISVDTARSFNQQYVGQFSFIEPIRHLITGREGLIEAQQNGAGFSTQLSFHVASTVDFRGVWTSASKKPLSVVLSGCFVWVRE